MSVIASAIRDVYVVLSDTTNWCAKPLAIAAASDAEPFSAVITMKSCPVLEATETCPSRSCALPR